MEKINYSRVEFGRCGDGKQNGPPLDVDLGKSNV